MESIENGTFSFYDPFLSCFPQDSIEFRVSLNKSCYRVIRCMPEHTFEDLHLAIQKAFDFGDNWQFNIIVNIKNEPGAKLKKPEIIKSVGKSPKQYRSFDDEDDEDEDE